MDAPAPPPVPPAAPVPGWWARNWKWVVPTGCLGILALGAALIALIVMAVFGALKSSEVYGQAVARARESSAVTGVLGTPVEEGFFVGGNLSVTPSSGEADLAIPLTGPDGSGTLYAVAQKSAGEWTFQTLVFEDAATGTRVDLLAAGTDGGGSP